MCNERKNSDNGSKKYQIVCVWKECVKCFQFDETHFFLVVIWYQAMAVVSSDKSLFYLFFAVVRCLLSQRKQ